MAELTGRKVLAITVSAFAVIIGVNLVMAFKAISTFPGLEVKNSYVASQNFDTERAAQQALGWSLTSDYDASSNALRLTFTDAEGLPVLVQDLAVLVGRSTEAKDDQTPEFIREAGAYLTRLELAPGKWLLRVTAKAADGTLFQQRLDLFVKG